MATKRTEFGMIGWQMYVQNPFFSLETKCAFATFTQECDSLLRTTILNVEDDEYSDEEKERIQTLIGNNYIDELTTYFRGFVFSDVTT